jgi:hypothetical protein
VVYARLGELVAERQARLAATDDDDLIVGQGPVDLTRGTGRQTRRLFTPIRTCWFALGELRSTMNPTSPLRTFGDG